jgi:RNA polymerase sigma-70 factor (ECF subfamily)
VPTEIEPLYREHRARLVRLVERELRDHQDAEDVVQTAFLDAQRALERGTIPRNPRAWLAAIALNAACRSRRGRLKAEPLEDYPVQDASETSDIRAALTNLPTEQRAAVLYRDVLGLSYCETAERMGTSVNAVTMLLHRGRRRLRQSLGVTAGGVGLWRWLRRAGTSQVAVAKGAGAVIVAAGLTTGGIVAAGRVVRVVAPIRTDAAPTLVTHGGSPTAGGGRTAGGALALDSARRDLKTVDGSSPNVPSPATQGFTGDATPATGVSSAAGVPASQSSSILPVPTVSLSTPPIPALPTTVVETVTVSTPITTVTVTTTAGTTATVTTPITTVTLPLP